MFSWLMLTPPLLFLLVFLGYPFFYGVYLSFFHKEVARAASFVGFGNFVKLSTTRSSGRRSGTRSSSPGSRPC